MSTYGHNIIKMHEIGGDCRMRQQGWIENFLIRAYIEGL